MKILLLLFLNISTGFYVFSQDCEKELIKELPLTFDSVYSNQINKIDSFINIVLKRENIKYKGSIKIMYIPEITYKNLSYENKIDTTNLLCYLDTKKMIIKDIYIFKDSIIFGRIYNIYGSLYLSDERHFYNIPLYLDKSKAELIFQIDGLDIYFFIKENNLFVTDFFNKNKNIYTAKEYLPDFIKKNHIWMVQTLDFATEEPKKRTKGYYFFSYIGERIKMIFK